MSKTLVERWLEESQVESEWDLTQRMMAGDFNPYHNKENGQFDFASSYSAVAPIKGKTENGQRLLDMYKSQHGGKKLEEGKKAEAEKKPAETGEKAPQKPEDIFTEEALQNLDKLEEEIVLARFNENIPEDVLEELESWVKDARKAAEAAAERKALHEASQKAGKLGTGEDFQSIDNDQALVMAEEMEQTKAALGRDYNLVSGKGAGGYFGTSNSFEINMALRDENKGYDGLDSDQKKVVDAMDRNMAPLPRAIKTLRKVGATGVLESMSKQGIPTDESAVGKVFMDGGYSSSSFDLNENVFKHRNLTMHIDAPKGSMAFISPERTKSWNSGKDNQVDEAEIVFARSTGFLIKGFKKSTNKWGDEQIDMYVEVVVDDDLV